MLLLLESTWGQLENLDQQDQVSSQWVPTHNKGMGSFSFANFFYQLFDDSVASKICTMCSNVFPTVTEN